MPPRTGQKRSAGSEAEASTSRAKAPPPKKTRFVDPSEDPTNFAEEVEANLEQTTRKGRVKNEGYDSDSSDDGEGVVESRKKGADDEDDDMFAVDKDDKKDDASAKKKKEEYLRLGDIEGQEFGDSGSEEDSEDDEPEDEDDAERKKKEGMGFEMSSFNMRDEMEEGKFTEDGTYVKSFDPHGVHDRWMEGLDEREIKLARRRKRQHERQQKERMRAEEKEIEESGGKGALEKELLSMLNKGETVLEALQRLGVQAKKSGQTKKAGKSKADDVMNVDKSAHKTASAPSAIERITHLASTIMSLGDTDIYSKTFEELVRSVRSSGLVDPEWVPPSNDKQYEYKWRVEGAGQPGQVFGPFSKEDMAAWYKAAYFGSTGEKVEVRETGGEWSDWGNVLEPDTYTLFLAVFLVRVKCKRWDSE
ncbi:CD2 antigen cytoplasmic tail-binding protein 2 [Mycena venus]|uniref:CD2 antigen cytoplasmic tail-binding protein 2 n=1 Tax=Mycena venus TaxID=2733690 RepID=A0A8H6XCX1_9AGAR|nr:CD2 antigen cytoplasmic tail-binding protein 2 [Mycena venus]